MLTSILITITYVSQAHSSVDSAFSAPASWLSIALLRMLVSSRRAEKSAFGIWSLAVCYMLHYCHMGGVAEMDQNLKSFFLKAFVQPQDDSRHLEEGRGGSGCGPSGTSGRETQPE